MELPVSYICKDMQSSPVLLSANLHPKVDFHVLVLIAAKCTLRQFWNRAPFGAVLMCQGLKWFYDPHRKEAAKASKIHGSDQVSASFKLINILNAFCSPTIYCLPIRIIQPVSLLYFPFFSVSLYHPGCSLACTSYHCPCCFQSTPPAIALLLFACLRTHPVLSTGLRHRN